MNTKDETFKSMHKKQKFIHWKKVRIHISNGSHKQWKHSLETLAVYREISLVSWNFLGQLRRGSATFKSPSCYYGKNRGRYTSNWKKVESRKILVINTSFIPKYVHLHGWSLRFGQNKDVSIERLKFYAKVNTN